MTTQPRKRVEERARLKADERRELILDCAVQLMAEGNYEHFTLREIAGRADVAPGLISHHFGTIDRLKHDAITAGCKREIWKVILIGLAQHHAFAIDLPDHIKRKAAILGTEVN